MYLTRPISNHRPRDYPWETTGPICPPSWAGWCIRPYPTWELETIHLARVQLPLGNKGSHKQAGTRGCIDMVLGVYSCNERGSLTKPDPMGILSHQRLPRLQEGSLESVSTGNKLALIWATKQNRTEPKQTADNSGIKLHLDCCHSRSTLKVEGHARSKREWCITWQPNDSTNVWRTRTTYKIRTQLYGTIWLFNIQWNLFQTTGRCRFQNGHQDTVVTVTQWNSAANAPQRNPHTVVKPNVVAICSNSQQTQPQQYGRKK